MGMVTAAGVICRDAPRPMWARKSPPLEAPQQTSSALESLIMEDIKAATRVVDLENVAKEWGGSFNYVHVSAALLNCGKLPGGACSMISKKLCAMWLAQLPADSQGCNNVFWACTRLGTAKQLPAVWGPTYRAFLQHVQQGSGVSSAQSIALVLWACAKLRQSLPTDELQSLTQAFLRPNVLSGATS